MRHQHWTVKMLFLEGNDLPLALLSQHVRCGPFTTPSPPFNLRFHQFKEVHRADEKPWHFHSNTTKPRPPQHTPVSRLDAAPKNVEQITCFWRMFTNRRITDQRMQWRERITPGTSALVSNSDSLGTTIQISTYYITYIFCSSYLCFFLLWLNTRLEIINTNELMFHINSI